MIIDRSKNFLRRYEDGCHLPYCHLEIHLGELEQSIRTHQQTSFAQSSHNDYFSCSIDHSTLIDDVVSPAPTSLANPVHRLLCSVPSAHLLKNCGIRSPSDRPPSVLPPYLEVPLLCRGIEMWGFIWWRGIVGSGLCPLDGLPCRRSTFFSKDSQSGKLLMKAQDPSTIRRRQYSVLIVGELSIVDLEGMSLPSEQGFTEPDRR